MYVVFVLCDDVQRAYQMCCTLVHVVNTMHLSLSCWAPLWKTCLISVIVGFHSKLSSCWPHSWWVSFSFVLLLCFIWTYTIVISLHI